ncbi:uroporphyrinogen decarboxylase [archaeon]|nr:MAG: uroporphyrinogen decarboxylase [archaeon]
MWIFAQLLLITVLVYVGSSWRMAGVSMDRVPLTMMSGKVYIKNDLMIRAAQGQPVERTPVWVFRQAGRHLPEYNEYKKIKGKSFLELLQHPRDVAECTMQPIRRYNLDAAILFSDILVVLQALGIDVDMPGGLGITVSSPLSSPSEVYTWQPKSINVKVKLGHIMEAIKLIKQELNNKVPLIGFSAAPWTLMYYLVGGSSKKNQQVASSWLQDHPQESTIVLDILTDVIIDYMSAQVDAGADMLQVFEAMGDFISEYNFYIWALPRLQRIRSAIKQRHPDIPVLVFPRGACYAIAALQEAGYDVVSIDTRTDRPGARSTLDASFTSGKAAKLASIQGNFDVALLEKDKAGNSVQHVQQAVEKMLRDLGTQRLIANLGEGLTGKEDPLLVQAFIDSVHHISEEMISSNK